jgi:hypothetical protein
MIVVCFYLTSSHWKQHYVWLLSGWEIVYLSWTRKMTTMRWKKCVGLLLVQPSLRHQCHTLRITVVQMLHERSEESDKYFGSKKVDEKYLGSRIVDRLVILIYFLSIIVGKKEILADKKIMPLIRDLMWVESAWERFDLFSPRPKIIHSESEYYGCDFCAARNSFWASYNHKRANSPTVKVNRRLESWPLMSSPFFSNL